MGKISKMIAISALALTLYSGACIVLNAFVGLSNEERLSVGQARELIALEQERPYLRGRKVNFIPLGDDPLFGEGLGGLSYSSGRGFDILMDQDHIYKKLLLHEIGHAIISRFKKGENHTLEEALKYINNPPLKTSIKDVIGYALSPEEFFCNAYALLHK
ncbi:MAG TPA: hypothetical protein VMC07_02255 [Candidatus Omnitrophota bacterium]|nr:hypothetical protein [Candidatus Omnitrophota bacterium]